MEGTPVVVVLQSNPVAREAVITPFQPEMKVGETRPAPLVSSRALGVEVAEIGN
jgi:hypothetical protein